MTIEALGKLNNVAEITSATLIKLYDKVNLKDINKRLKSYTMVFSLNNLLVNPAKKVNNAGESTYHHLLNSIMNEFENEGDKVCEISGLRFNKTFEDFYKEELERQKRILVKEIKDAKQLNKEIKNLDNTDTSLNRSWFPLIGGLGSDAQALPQAKFTVQIHPICIPILQFLPLSSVLYKGGVLLIDSSNFELSREMVAQNTKTLQERIEATKGNGSVENVRDFAKGDYLLSVLEILEEKEAFRETYSDLNMWSFSNSGTGASCEIDRVPNSLIKKLQFLNSNPNVGAELKSILVRNESAFSFIEALESNKDWYLLYPNVFGSGKKKVEYKGVTPEFLGAYYTVIQRSDLLQTSKYIAGLMQKYKSKTFEKLLEKTDANADPEYRVELYKILTIATEKGEWDLNLHIHILDNQNLLPIKNNFYQIHKLSYYYYFKEIFSSEYPIVDIAETKVYRSLTWLISLIQNDSKFATIKSNLSNANEYAKVGFNRMIYDSIASESIKIENAVELLYDESFRYSKWGLNELLRIFFSQPEQGNFNILDWKNELEEDELFRGWKEKVQDFVNDYKEYYFTKYQNPITQEFPLKKFESVASDVVKENDNFYSLLNEMIYNTNQFLNETQQYKDEKWSIEELLTDPLGYNNWNLCVFTIKFFLKETAIKNLLSIIEN
ncbi:MAG: hypothetical protein QM727_04600 [Niabella sp.]